MVTSVLWNRSRLLAVLVAILLVVPPVLAHGGDHEDENEDDDRRDAPDDGEDAREERGNGDEAREEARRKVELSVEGTDARFRLEREDGGNEEELSVGYNAQESRLRLEFENETEDSEKELLIEVTMKQLLEYVDEDGDGAYTEGVDTVLANHTLSTLPWRVHTPSDVERDGVTGKRLPASAALPEAGNVSLEFYAFGDFVDLNGVGLRPSDVKFDLLIEDYPYQHNASALAVEARVKVKASSELEDAGDGETAGPAVEAVMDGLTGYFRWEDWVLVDGERMNVTATVFRDESKTEADDGEAEFEREQRLYLSYPRGTTILHDPTMGVALESASSGTEGDGTTDDGTGDDGTGGGDTGGGESGGDSSADDGSGDDGTGDDGAGETPPATNPTPFPAVTAVLVAVGAVAVARRRHA